MNLLASLRFLVVLLSLVGLVTAQDPRSEEPLRYMRVSAEDASVRNLADERGNELARPAKSSLVGVFRELKDWLEVEVPGGYAVWVHGRYLRSVPDAEGILEVTRNAINMRPLPNSSVTSFPLPQRLHAGDRVRFIEFLDPQSAMEETWVRIWSPPGVRAWIPRSAVESLPSGQSGAAVWKDALANLAGTEAPPVERKEAPNPKKSEEEQQAAALAEASAKSAETEARQALDAARALLGAERAKPTPDFVPVRRALESVVSLSPEGGVGVEARHELRLLEFHEEHAALRAELELERKRRTEELMERQEEVWRESKSKDPLRDAFAVRGVLKRRPDANGTPHFFVYFGGDEMGEVVCTSGRYDLDLFAGYEVGVQGTPFGATEEDGRPAAFEVSRLEVIARR